MKRSKFKTTLLKATVYVVIGAFLLNGVYIEAGYAKEETLKPVVRQDTKRAQKGLAAYFAGYLSLEDLVAYLEGERAIEPGYYRELKRRVARTSALSEEVLRKLQKSTHIEDAIKVVVSIYPEMSWLTGDVNATPEGVATAEGVQSISEKLFGEKHIEFNRTAVGIMTILWVLNGDYESFTASQGESVRLTRENFEGLKAYTEHILQNDPEALDALIVYTVINDLGKIRSIVDLVRAQSGVEEVDHDRVLTVVLEEHPELAPSFNRLSDRYKRLIANGMKAQFNFGQFVQGENVPGSLIGLSGLDSESLNFYMLHVLYDIAGAAGHVKETGSLVVTEPTYQGFKQGIAAINQIGEGATFIEAYNFFLRQKAATFNLDITNPVERAVTRICAMLRLSDAERAHEVLELFNTLEPNERAILKKELNLTGIDDGYAVLLYYAPATLANALKSLEEAGDSDAFRKGLQISLKAFARIFQEARIALKGRKGNGVFTVDVGRLAEMAKANPHEVDNVAINLKKIGEDAKINLSQPTNINVDRFAQLDGLSELPGQKIIPIGIGGGSDIIQATMLGKLLRESGKTIPAVISVRTTKTGSQGATGKIGETRTIQNHGGEISKGVYRILPETVGTGRFLENIPANEVLVFLVMDAQDGTLAERIQAVINYIGGVDAVLSVDTGGDALYAIEGDATTQAKATPDQDLRVLRALSQISLPVITAEIATGIDSPDYAEGVLTQAEAQFYQLGAKEKEQVLETYRVWEMDGSDEGLKKGRYGKTPFSWQIALNKGRGWQCISLPARVVLDDNNPWNPFVNISHSTEGIFFMQLDKHLSAIQKGKDTFMAEELERKELEILASLMKDPAFLREMAEHLLKAYNEAAESNFAIRDSDEPSGLTIKDLDISMNLLGFLALETGVNALMHTTRKESSVKELLQLIIADKLNAQEKYLMMLFANAAWKAGVPFRVDTEKVDGKKRSEGFQSLILRHRDFVPVGLSGDMQREQDVIQIQAAAQTMLEILRDVSNPQDQLEVLNDSLKNPEFLEKIAHNCLAAYNAQTRNNFTIRNDNTATGLTERDLDTAMNLAGFIALETGIAGLMQLFRHKGKSISEILDLIAEGKLNSEEKMLMMLFANVTWKAGVPFRVDTEEVDGKKRSEGVYSRVIRHPDFINWHDLPSGEQEKDIVQIQTAAAKLLLEQIERRKQTGLQNQDTLEIRSSAMQSSITQDMSRRAIRERFIEVGIPVLAAWYLQSLVETERYCFMLGEEPTRKEGLKSSLTAVRSGTEQLKNKKDMKYPEFRQTMGKDDALKAIYEIHALAENFRTQKIDPQTRIQCSISETLLNRISYENPKLAKALGAQSIRQFLNNNTMLDIIADSVDAEVVLAIPYAKLVLHGLARLNVAFFLETFEGNPEELYSDPSYERAVELLAATTVLITDDGSVYTTRAKLLKKARALKDPAFLSTPFRSNLPPTSEVDWNRRLAIEAEVLRAL